MILIFSLISNSSSPLSKPLGTNQSTPTLIDIMVKHMLYSIFSSQAKFKYLSFFSFSFLFTLWSNGTAKSTIGKVLFFLISSRIGLQVRIRRSVYTRCIRSVSSLFLYSHLKLVLTLENTVCYCYTSYEMTDQFLWFQVQINSYSRNQNTPY